MGSREIKSSIQGLKSKIQPIGPKPSFQAEPKIQSSKISIRSKSNIPGQILSFFRLDPQSGQRLSEESRLFHAQVWLHELDEGVQKLIKMGKVKVAQQLLDWNLSLLPFQRIDMLRIALKASQPPEKFYQSLKVRNNQDGSIYTHFGSQSAIALTHHGWGYKDRNEDGYLLMPQQQVLAIADGMGGHFGGDMASGIAIDFFEYGIQKGLDLSQAISLANEAILIRSGSFPHGDEVPLMGTTFTAAQLWDHSLKVAHIGDSKILLIRDKEIIFQTQDHTLGQQLLKEGLVDCATAVELNHVLNRGLGLDHIQAKRDIQRCQIPVKKGDRILLVSDGVTDNFFDQNFQLNELIQLVAEGSLQLCAKKLLETTKKLMTGAKVKMGRDPKPDNLTIAMLDIQN